jgi:glycerol-3-phosphate dehydrogenase
VKNYSPAIGINVRRGAVEGLHYLDGASGTEHEVRARVIINAAGPWVDRVLATVNRELPRFMGGTKGSHIVVGRFEGAPSSAFYVEARQDGRPFFIIPWNGQYLIGTTDIRYDGDPGDVVAGTDEIRYLLDETNRVFPAAALTASDIHYAYAGVRPLPRSEKGPESAITRRHIIHKHRKQARGLISIIGGKLTTYRSLAEQAVDIAVRGAGIRSGACRTRSVPLPGAADLGRAVPRLGSTVTPACAQRLLAIYGSRAGAILELHRDDGAGTYLDAGRTVLAAEVLHAVRNEFAVSLVDIVHRRIMTGLAPDQGAATARATAQAAAVAAGWDDSETASQLAALAEYNRRFQSFRIA